MGRPDFFQVFYVRTAQICLQHISNRFHTVLTRALDIPCQLPPDIHIQMVLSAQKQKFLLQHRIQFLHCHDLLKAVHKLQHQLLRHGVGGGDLEDTDPLIAVQGFHHRLIVDAVGDNPLSRFLILPVQQIEPIRAEILADHRIALLYHPVVGVGQAWKDHPFIGIFHKTLGFRKTDTFF